MKFQGLYEQIEAYSKSDYYPFHMPGHKRQMQELIATYGMDITEIEGFDNLHHAEGILKEAMSRMAHIFGAKYSYYLVNGSTAGILSAITACTKPQDTILIGRNCHKAVYHSGLLRMLKVKYLYLESEPMYGILGGISVSELERELTRDHFIRAVVITSPTYDGVVSDIQAISNVVHQYKIPLIVDEAHGAHFGFSPYFPKSALTQGADVVIQSLHKTLPSLTQTAVLHISKNSLYIDCESIEKYLSMYQTSSPSYLFMTSMDLCTQLLEKDGQHLFFQYEKKLDTCRRQLGGLKNIKLVTKKIVGTTHIWDFDASKLLFSVKGTSFRGQELYQCLLEKYHLQMELVSGDYVLGMTSVMDTEEGFNRLVQAVFEIDQQAGYKKVNQLAVQYPQNEKILELYEADNQKQTKVLLSESVGKISGEFIYLYPPGIPILVPGEKIGGALLKLIYEYQSIGLSIQGLSDVKNHTIKIVNL